MSIRVMPSHTTSIEIPPSLTPDASVRMKNRIKDGLGQIVWISVLAARRARA
jgi:hypothetical protein